MSTPVTTIKEKYEDESLPGSFSGLHRFSKAQKIRNLPEVRRELESYDVYSLFRPTTQKFIRRATVFPFLWHTVVADLLQLTQYKRQNKGFQYVLICVEGLSRYLWCRKLKNKSAIEVEKAFKSIFEEQGRYPLRCHVDRGKEFYNWRVKAYFEERGIEIYSTSSSTKASIAERGIF